MLIQTSGSDQCNLPVDQRTGAWVCLDDAQAVTATGTASAKHQIISPNVLATGDCNAKGCWYVDSDYKARNTADGKFGCDGTTLGTVSMTAAHTLNGAQMKTKTEFKSTVGVRTLEAEGDLLRGDSSTDGTEVSGQYDTVDKSSLAGGTWWKPWGTGYYSSYDKQYTNHANVIEYSWEKGSYPGFWWMYQKGCIAHDPDGNNIYTFHTSDFRFANSSNAGWYG